MVARSIVLKKIIGWAEKNRVDRETRTAGILFLGLGIALTKVVVYPKLPKTEFLL